MAPTMSARRRLAVVLLIGGTLVFGTTTSAAAQFVSGGTFTDDNGSIHEPDIEAVAAAGTTRGCNAVGDRYCPSQPVTRGEMAAFLTRALNLPPGQTAPFTDITGSQFSAEIAAIWTSGITEGCSTTGDRFCPEQSVTRAEMAAFLTRALGLPPGGPTPFGDIAGSPFAPDIAAIFGAGITQGITPIIYDPEGPVTRAQMASFLVRGLGLPPVASPPPVGQLFRLTNDLGNISALFPPAWADVLTDCTLFRRGIPVGPCLVASTDLGRFQLGWDAPGALVGASATTGLTPAGFLDGEPSLLGTLPSECATYEGRFAYHDGAYTGLADRWHGCGPTGASAVIVAATPSAGSFLVVVVAKYGIAASDRSSVDWVAHSLVVDNAEF